MAQNRIDLTEKADLNLRIFMAKKGIYNKSDAVNAILEKLKV